jgi:hypothetical protein
MPPEGFAFFQSGASAEGAAMFAPLTAKAQLKPSVSTTTSRAPRAGVHEQASLRLSRRTHNSVGKASINNRDPDLASKSIEAPDPLRAPSSDFGKVPVFASGRAERFQTPPPDTALRLFSQIQAKLEVGAVDDPLEHEADRVAEQVTRMPAAGISTTTVPPQISRKCAACEEEEQLQKKHAGTAAITVREVPAVVHEVLRAPGHPLDNSSRAYFESRFGHDFSRVRVHSGAAANRSAQTVNARAYTVGHNIVFGSSQFAPRSQEGRRLIAHELTHVLQQSGGRSLHGEFAGQHISRASASLLSRKTPGPDAEKQKNETEKNKAVKQHIKQLRHVADYLDKARKLRPNPKSNLRDSDSLFRNTVGLLDHGKLTLTVLSPTHYSANYHFDARVKFDSRGFPTTAPDYPADPRVSDAGLVFDDKTSFGAVRSDVPDAPQPAPQKVEQAPARVEYRTGKSEPTPTTSAPPPAKTSIQPPVAASPFIPGDVRLFTRGMDITEDNFKNTFVHEGQHIADLTPRLVTAHSADELLETYKSEFRAFWIQPPPPPPSGGIGQQAIDHLPEPKGKADNFTNVTISQPEHCKLCPPPDPSAKAGKAAYAEPKTGMKNPRQEAIFWHIISHYQEQQYDCCYVYDKHFHDAVNDFAFPQSVNLINSDRLMNLNLEMRQLNKSMTLAQVSSTKFVEVLTQLEPLDWVFLKDATSKPFWDALAIVAPGFLNKGVKALAEKGTKGPVSMADVSKALSEK